MKDMSEKQKKLNKTNKLLCETFKKRKKTIFANLDTKHLADNKNLFLKSFFRQNYWFWSNYFDE